VTWGLQVSEFRPVWASKQNHLRHSYFLTACTDLYVSDSACQ
jgi:hypothetical protein